MSPRTQKSDHSPEPLKNLFQREQESSGGNIGAAFIATLDELDRRMQATSQHVETTGRVFNHLIEWHKQVSQLLSNLPEKTGNQISKEIRNTIPLLQQSTAENARIGAREGVSYSQSAIDTLRETKDDYETQKHKISRTAFIGLPIAFGSAILCGFLFGSTVIAFFPSSWQWTCALVGAQHMTIQSSGEALCVIQK